MLGHVQKDNLNYRNKESLVYEEKELIEDKEQPELIEQFQEPMLEYSGEVDEEQEEVSPFNFNMDDFVKKSQSSYFDSDDSGAPDYIAPTMKIDDLVDKDDLKNVEYENEQNQEDEIYVHDEDENSEEETTFPTPIYHDLGVNTFKHYEINEQNEDDIYVDTSNVDEDEIYLNLHFLLVFVLDLNIFHLHLH